MKTHSPTTFTLKEVNHLPVYVDTYPDDGMFLRASKMKISFQSDAGYLNEEISISRASTHAHISENIPISALNGAVLTIAKIIKFVMSLEAEAELASLFVTTRKCFEIRRTLIQMGWPQHPTPMQVDNPIAVGVVTNNIIPKQTRSTDVRFCWLR